VPNYGETNPGLFTVITFPFLFGVMFGDIAHGMILLILSIYVIFMKDYIVKKKSILLPLVDIRYMVILMGFFATFCGFCYN